MQITGIGVEIRNPKFEARNSASKAESRSGISPNNKLQNVEKRLGLCFFWILEFVLELEIRAWDLILVCENQPQCVSSLTNSRWLD